MYTTFCSTKAIASAAKLLHPFHHMGAQYCRCYCPHIQAGSILAITMYTETMDTGNCKVQYSTPHTPVTHYLCFSLLAFEEQIFLFNKRTTFCLTQGCDREPPR